MTCKFGIGCVSCLSYEGPDKILQAFTRRHVPRATCVTHPWKAQKHASAGWVYPPWASGATSPNRFHARRNEPPQTDEGREGRPGMRSRDIFGRLRLRLRLRGSIPAPAPAPATSKTVRRLRLRLRLRCSSPHMSLNQNTIFKNAKYQNITSYWLGREFECTLNECLWNLSLVVIQGHWLTLERSQTPSGCAVWD